MPHAIRLFFLDDHPVIASGLALRYASLPAFSVVGTAASFREANDLIGVGTVDIVVADIQLEVPLTPRQVTTLAERTRVVLFSAHANAPIAQQLLAAGAAAALDKAAPMTVLDGVLRDVHAGITTKPGTGTATTTTAATAATAFDRLSAREYEVYAGLARCQTPKEIAAALGIARSTIYCHIDRIRQKLGVETLQELVALSWSVTDSREK
jgi:DNA-binding NarL/FixJ family response regulator